MNCGSNFRLQFRRSKLRYPSQRIPRMTRVINGIRPVRPGKRLAGHCIALFSRQPAAVLALYLAAELKGARALPGAIGEASEPDLVRPPRARLSRR